MTDGDWTDWPADPAVPTPASSSGAVALADAALEMLRQAQRSVTAAVAMLDAGRTRDGRQVLTDLVDCLDKLPVDRASDAEKVR